MKNIHTFESFLNEAANESTLEISGKAYSMWNDKKIQRELQDIKIKIVGDMKGVMTLSGDEEELNKVRAIFGIKESVNENELNELSFNSAGIQGLLHAVYHNWDSIKDKIKDEFYFKSFRDVLEFIKGGDQEEQRELETAIKGMGVEILNLDDKNSWYLK